MKTRLLWKLFLLNLLVIGIVVLVVWGAIDYLAKGYFVVLMEKYHISPTESHEMFIDSIHRYLIWGSLLAVFTSAIVSFIIMKRMLYPLTHMTQITQKIAAGDFTDKIPVSTRDEVGQLAAAFNRMTESLNHMELLRKTMIVDVAHELKTPLTNIQGYLEAVVDDVVPPTPDTIRLLQEETQRLAYLVSDILKLSRSGGAKISLDILKIKLLDAGNHLLKVFRLKLSEKNIAVDCDGIAPTCWVYADPHKLAQVLHNLFQNALQYTNPGGRLRIFAEEMAEEIQITFANTGGELTPEDLPLFFERFYRGEKSRSREYGGAGIGLAVVKDLVEAHKGKVAAHLINDEIHISFTLPKKPL
jgi:two-component system sensor histidine kinase BaeS